jgi:hypothetical protein
MTPINHSSHPLFFGGKGAILKILIAALIAPLLAAQGN